MAPLLILAIAIAGLVFGRDAAQGKIVDQIGSLVGPQQKAAKIMKIIDAGIVPVVASGLDQKVIGIVTDCDLCLGVIAEGRDLATATVKECMTGKVIICRPNDEFQHAVHLMEENQIRRIPVVEDDGTLVGIISLADIAQAEMVDSAKAGNTLIEVSGPSVDASKPRAEEDKH